MCASRDTFAIILDTCHFKRTRAAHLVLRSAFAILDRLDQLSISEGEGGSVETRHRDEIFANYDVSMYTRSAYKLDKNSVNNRCDGNKRSFCSRR